ncbi:MAG: hypothetical protein GY787_03975 [Alteromonadales bacterium]|nr:hypothetical protein [Alteromonadales bacterium]
MGVLSPQFGSLIPSLTTQTLTSNYLNFNSGGGNDFAQQYLPEIYEAEVERYGNRTLSGFLRMVGAEMPMMSDQVVWSEQNRLHIGYDNVSCSAVGANAGNRITLPGGVTNTVFVNMTVVIMDPANPAFTVKAIVVATGAAGAGGAGGAQNFDVLPYTRVNVNAGAALTGLKVFVYGSEFGKGSQGPTTGTSGQSIQPQLTTFSNKPIIIRDRYAVSGSDTAQIGWVEVASEDGTSGYLWYLKAEGETRLRFEDYLEMSMIEGELASAGQVPNIIAAVPSFAGLPNGGAGSIGTEGLFAAINNGGNVLSGYAGSLQDFDAVLENLDSQGAIEENMLFLDRKTELLFDNMLAQQNSYGAGGTSYGVFENSEDMALNLGFSGFRRGSYDFYKTSWKYLNDASTRGGSTNFVNGDNIDGVLVPAGTSTVYDQLLGTNIRRPFLHVRYRASQADDRRMKSWLTGSVGGASTSNLDAMEVNFLSERCLCVQARNNFVLFTA